MAEKTVNQIIVLEPSTKSVSDLLALVEEKGGVEIVRVSTPEEATNIVVSSLPCLFITSLVDNNTVPARVQLLKRLESAIKQHGLKVYMVTGIKNRQLADLFTQKMGVTDYIVDPVPVRTMLFKVNLALKAVDNFRKQQEMKRAAQEQIVIKKLDSKKVDAAAELAPKGKPALQMAEDTFLFKNGGAKKAGKKFMLELEGPDPSTGEWVPHADKGDAKSAWRWVPNEEKETQAVGTTPPDGWVHEGEKPTFNEETGKWAMSSETPALSLKKAGKTVAEKISLDEKGELVVAADSPEAEANLQKNKLKAAAAIKEREEKQKVLAEKKKAIDKAGLAEAKNSILADLAAEEEDTGHASSAEMLKKKGAKEKKARKDSTAALDSLMNSVESDESDEPSEFNNRLDGKKERLRSAIDKRDDIQRLNTAANEGAPASTGEEKIATKAASPLDFLKKKKEQLQQASLASGVNTIKANTPLKGANALKKGAEEENGPSAGVLNRKNKKGANGLPAPDRLARLREGLAESEEEEEQLSEFPPPESTELEPDEETNKSFHAEKKEKKRGNPALRLNAGEEESDKGSPRLKLKEKKKKTLEAIQEKLLAPLPEEMPPEEEAELRKELGLEGRPEIKVKELARKKRLAEVQRMKDLLAEIDEEMEQQGEAIGGSFDSNSEEEEKRGETGNLSREKLKGIRSAIDGGETDDFSEDTEERKKLRSSVDEKNKRAGIADDASYMPEAELLPLGNAWESADGYFVYLNAQVRYKGFATLDEVLPLWIFKGEQQPELLDKSKQWRFYGGLPVQARKASEIPAPVRDYLLAIRDQLLANGQSVGEEAGENGGSEIAKKKKDQKSSSSSALDRLRAKLDEENEEENAEAVAAVLSGDNEDEGALDLTSGSGKFKPGGEVTLPGEELDGLKARKARRKSSDSGADAEQELEETLEGDAAAKKNGATAKKGGKSSAAAGLDALARLRNKMKAAESEQEEAAEEENTKNSTRESEHSGAPLDREQEQEESEEPAKSRIEKLRAELEEEAESVEPASAKEKKKARAGEEISEEEEAEQESAELSPLPNSKNKDTSSKKPMSALDRLREKLEKSAEEPIEPEAEAPEEENTKKDTSAATDSSLEAPRDEASTAEAAIANKPAASEAVRKFMERRRNKAAKETVKQEKTRAEAAQNSAAVYLGIYVSLSDSLAQEKNASIAVPRVLKAFEESFGDCAALCTGLPDKDNSAQVRYCSPSSPDTTTRVQLNSGIFEPIAIGDGGAGDLLGYLFLQARGARSVFSEAERSTIKRIARKLWPILKRDSQDQESEAA